MAGDRSNFGMRPFLFWQGTVPLSAGDHSSFGRRPSSSFGRGPFLFWQGTIPLLAGDQVPLLAGDHSFFGWGPFLFWQGTIPAQFLSWSLRSTHLSERSGKVQQRLVVLRTLWVPVRHHTFRHHITTSSLFRRLNLLDIGGYYHNRLLRCAGHVARMPMSRAQPQLLTSWVAHSRPAGCPKMTWGRTLENALTSKGISKKLRNGLPLRGIDRSGDSGLAPNQNLLMPDG